MEQKSLLRLVRYYWAVVVVCGLLGGAGGVLASDLMTPEYTARTYVMVSVIGGSSSEVTQSTNYSQQQARNFSAVATREIVLQPVIDDLELDMSVADLRQQISATVPLNTTQIAISVVDTSPARAAALANSVAEQLSAVVPQLTPQVDDESPVQLDVIESATTPEVPSAPSTTLYAFLGLLAGLVVATVVVVLRGIVYARVRTKEQITELTGATVIGSIQQTRAAARHPMALTDPSQVMRAEEYRQLRANLRYLQRGEHHRVFVVTSSIPSEGKSSTAANLAASLAASGQSVCLVEADLRRPALGDMLDLPEGVGLTSVLMAESTIEESLQSWGPNDLQVLLAGDVPPNPSELLESEAAGAVIERLTETFDAVIVDSPPLNAVSDAAVLARQFGGVILVVGARRVRASELRRAAERLETIGTSIQGAVLNLATQSEADSYHRGYPARPQDARRAREPRAGAGSKGRGAHEAVVGGAAEARGRESTDPASATPSPEPEASSNSHPYPSSSRLPRSFPPAPRDDDSDADLDRSVTVPEKRTG